MSRSRRWSNTAYPFSFEPQEDSLGTFRSRVLVSNDGWIELELETTGWTQTVESQSGGFLSQRFSRTVIQVARDSQAVDLVLTETSDALACSWFDPVVSQRVRTELDIALRARAQGKL